MKKITFWSKKKYHESKPKERITIQLRWYNEKGTYDKDHDEKSTFTLWLKDCDMERATHIISNALMNSKLIDEFFEVE